MSRTQKNLISVCIVLCFGISSFKLAKASESVTTWSAIQVNKQIITSNEVLNYIDSVVISSDFQAEIFKKTDSNYSLYKSQKTILMNSLFKATIQKIAITRLLQAQAVKVPGRKFFAISKKELASVLENNIKAALAPFQKSNLSSEEIQFNFVQNLKDHGFPYDLNASSNEIFNKWANRLKFRLTEEYRQKEANRFLCSLDNCDQLEPVAIFENYKKAIESNSYLVLRYTANETLKGNDAFKSISTDLVKFKVLESMNSVSKIKHIFYLGQIVDQKIDLLHINDWNLLGKNAEKLGYPNTDDFGRTSSLLLNYTRSGVEGSLSVDVDNWLFSKKIGVAEGGYQQHVEEENSIRIASRHFLDDKGNKWILVGITATNTTQKAAIGSWLQENFHKLNPGVHAKYNVNRNNVEGYLQGLIGVGGNYSIIDTDHVDLILSGEGVASPTAGSFGDNSIAVTTSLDLNIYGRNTKSPILQLGFFSEYKILANGELETMFGAKATVSLTIKRLQLQAGLFLVRWNGEMDREYEGGASWTTGLLLSGKLTPRHKVIEYAFN